MTVAFAYLHPGWVEGSFHTSLIRLMQYDAMRHGGRQLGAHIPVTCNSGGIASARNAAVAYYLKHCKRDEWFWFVDSDMGFAPNTVEQLLASADAKERPIVGGLCFAQREVEDTPDDLAVPRSGYFYVPTIYRYNGDVGLPQSIVDYPRDEMVQCFATGAACLLVHRTVFEKVREAYPEPEPWFHDKYINGSLWSEDIVFCARANTCGFPLYVNTAIKTSHKKIHYLTEDSVGDLVGQPVSVPA